MTKNNIIDAAFEIAVFSKTHAFPKENSPEFFEFAEKLDRLATEIQRQYPAFNRNVQLAEGSPQLSNGVNQTTNELLKSDKLVVPSAPPAAQPAIAERAAKLIAGAIWDHKESGMIVDRYDKLVPRILAAILPLLNPNQKH